MGEQINHKPSEKRQIRKAQKKRGKKYLKEKGIDEVEWCRQHDSLYQVKGMKRYFIIRGRR